MLLPRGSLAALLTVCLSPDPRVELGLVALVIAELALLDLATPRWKLSLPLAKSSSRGSPACPDVEGPWLQTFGLRASMPHRGLHWASLEGTSPPGRSLLQRPSSKLPTSTPTGMSLPTSLSESGSACELDVFIRLVRPNGW